MAERWKSLTKSSKPRVRKMRDYWIDLEPRRNLSEDDRRIVGTMGKRRIRVTARNSREARKSIDPYPYKITKVRKVR